MYSLLVLFYYKYIQEGYMKEEWKIWKISKRGIVYEVSNKGRCKKNGKIFTPKISKDQYVCVFGSRLHRIVAMLFIPNPDNKPQVDHIDTNKHNNNVNNLRWVTIKENQNNQLSIQHQRDIQRKVQKQYYKDHPERKLQHSKVMKEYWNKVRSGEIMRN